MKQRLAGCLLLLPAAVLAAPAPPASAAPVMETVIVGEREAALGLYLLPWKEEAASDIDHPPRYYVPPAPASDLQQFRLQVEDAQANAAYRRVRLEPR